MNSTEIQKRDNSIDVMKGFITLIMILSHSMVFTGLSQKPSSFYVHLTTFSGFMFCFGYVCNVAYLQKENLPWKKMLRGGIKTILAYYYSAFLYIFLIKHLWDKDSIINILTQRKIAGYSEFLLSWAYLYIIMILLAPLLKFAARSKYICVILILISLGSTFIDYGMLTVPWLGPIIGCCREEYFPLVQYFSYFLIGCYFNQHKKTFSLPIILISIISSLVCLVYCVQFSETPRRCGPSILWIIGGYFFVYAYFLIAKKLVANKHTIPSKITDILSKIGQKTLLFLLVNNTCCFAFCNLFYLFSNHSILVRIILCVFVICFSIFVSAFILRLSQERIKQK